MKARTIVLAAALLVFFAGALSAFDWGGTLDNRSTLDYQKTTDLLQQNRLALWLEAGLGKSLTLTVQGSYTFSLETQESASSIVEHILDIDLLRLEGHYPSSGSRKSLLAFTAGRFPLAEFTGLVLDDTVDGVQVRFSNALLNASLAIAFTGLELAPVSTVSMSWADENDRTQVPAEPGLVTLLAPPRLVELLQVEFPELIGRNDLRVALLAQQDLRSQSGLIQKGDTLFVTGRGGRLSSEFLGAGVGGPLAAGLYYDFLAWLSVGRTLSYIGGAYDYAWLVSGLVGAGLRYYREEWLNFQHRLGLLLATGDSDYTKSYFEGNTDGLATAFVSVTSTDLGLVFSPRLGNLAVAQAAWSIKPAEILQIELTGWVFLRPTTGQISDSRLDTTSDSRYLGSEIDLRANLRPFSDLGGALSLGLFLPGTAFSSSYRDPELVARMEISLSF
jgi:hypothetical protein